MSVINNVYIENGNLECNPSDKQLARRRISVQKKLRRYNRLMPGESSKRKSLIRRVIPDIGENCSVYPPFFCDYGYNIHIGDNFFANVGCVILDTFSITIGDNVMIGPHTVISTAGHPIDPATRNSGVIHGKPIIIQDNVWIGANCTINPGVTIGKNSVIGSGSVVVHDISPNVVAAGNPCRYIKGIL